MMRRRTPAYEPSAGGSAPAGSLSDAGSMFRLVALVVGAIVTLHLAMPSITSIAARSLRGPEGGDVAMAAYAVQADQQALVGQLQAQVESLALRLNEAEKNIKAKEFAAEKEIKRLQSSLARVEEARQDVEAKVADLAKHSEKLAARAPASNSGANSGAARQKAVDVAAPPLPATLIDLSTTEKRVFSQNGEDGVIDAIFGSVGTASKYYVEFGTESGAETNTRVLREQKGWTGLLLDGSNNNPSINLHAHFLTAENIAGLFQQYGVPRDLDLLSIDIDRNDWYIFRSLVAPRTPGDLSTARYRPRVIVVEYNSDWAPPDDKVVPYDGSVSAAALTRVGNHKLVNSALR